VETRSLGDVEVTAIGMGCWPIADRAHELGRAGVDATVRAALGAGVRLFDTARAYCPRDENGFGERQLADALGRTDVDRDEVVVATKVVSTRAPGGSWVADGTPAAVHAFTREALANLGVERIDLLQAHTVDPRVPWAETVGALREVRDEGLAAAIGVSNVTAAQVREAHAIVALASVQNESGADGIDEEVLGTCSELGVGFLPYSPFGGPHRAGRLEDRHPVLAEVAARHGATAHQVCLAWLLALDPVVVPIPGATRPGTISASAAATDLRLDEEDLTVLDAALRRDR
jgi:aryl-alcohol dehydrogenase-like predicted oxidoreductase